MVSLKLYSYCESRSQHLPLIADAHRRVFVPFQVQIWSIKFSLWNLMEIPLLSPSVCVFLFA